MSTPSSVTEHTLEVVRGNKPQNMACLEKHAKLSNNVTVSPVHPGRVVHLNNSLEFELGVTGIKMPIFLVNGSLSADVDAMVDPLVGTAAVNPDGTLTGLVATGGFEFESTEFDTDRTYTVNQPLRAVASNSNATSGGRLTNESVTLYTNTICGIVSAPKRQNHHKRWVLRFWSVFLPGAAA